MSAAPSATLQNFSAEPIGCRLAPGLLLMKASVRPSPCDRLTAAIHESVGQGRVRIGVAGGGPAAGMIGAGLMAAHMLDGAEPNAANRDTADLIANRGVQ